MNKYLIVNGNRVLINYDEDTGDYEIIDDMDTPDDAIIAGYPELVTVTKDLYAAADTNISIDEIYNQLQINCDQKEIEELITSPLNEDDLYSPYTNKQKYCTELYSFGEGKDAINGFRQLVVDGFTDYEDGGARDWYIQVYKSKNWVFNGDQYIPDDASEPQWKVLQRARQNTCTAFLCAFGSTGQIDMKDNAVQTPAKMTTYLVLSINGNRLRAEADQKPSESELRAAAPVAEYVGNLAGGYLSPTDNSTTNYIVISGKFIATSAFQHGPYPVPDPMWPFKQFDYPLLLNNQNALVSGGPFWHCTCHLNDDKNEDGAYYTTKFYDNPTPQSPDVVRMTVDAESLYPYNSEWSSLKEFEYNYSSAGDETDKLFKMPFIQCTLKVGDKYAVEFADENGRPTYKWLTINQCPVKDGYVQNHIYLGPNPKIGDKIIGEEWDMCNTVDATMNIDAKGIAIPIKMEDKLSGKVEFTIDGPVNCVWNQIDKHTRRYWIFWKKTSWSEKLYQVLGHINQIMISDFEVKVYSDNAAINNIPDDQDLVYMSDVADNDFINKKDDIDFAISTALTTAECSEHGIRNTVKMNNPMLGDEPLRTVYNTVTRDTGKPEEHYLTHYYEEFTQPKMTVESTVKENTEHDFLTHYEFNSLEDKEFRVLAETKDVKMCRKLVKLKED